MSSWNSRAIRLALVFSCLVALFGIQLTHPLSSLAGFEPPQPHRAHSDEPQEPLAHADSGCIADSLSAGSRTFNRPTTQTTGSGLQSPCALTGALTPYNVYQFNLTGCATFPAQVTITTCGAVIAGSGCATAADTDTVIYLYRSGGSLNVGIGTINPFNPNLPCVNALAAHSELNGGASSNPGGSTCDQLNPSDCLPACPAVSTRLSGLKRSIGQGFFQVVVSGAGAADTGPYNLFARVTAAGCTLNPPTAVKLELVSATRYENGVAIDWKTGQEVDNLGFNVYREERGKRTQITPQIVAGSALLAGPGTTLGAGQSYSWLDSPLRTKDTQYWLEDIDLNGQSTWHGPVGVTDSGGRNSSPPKRGRSMPLSVLGKGNNNQSYSAPVESRAALPEITQAKMEVQSNLASQKAVKLSVKQEGFYRVSQPDLVRAGLSANLDPRLLQLYADGKQLPIAEVNTSNGRFDSSSAIEFYGTGIDSAVTDSRTYWLVAGTEPGLRISQVTAKASKGKSSATSFPYTVERKDRSVYFSALRNGEKENFFGAVIARNPVDQQLSLQHLDTADSEAFLEVSLQGVSQVPHRVQVQINGATPGEISFYGQAEGAARFSIPQALLKEGENTVTLIPKGEQFDVSLVDYVRVTYQRRFTADDDALKFTSSRKKSVTVDGFSNAAIRVFDISEPSNVKEIYGKVRQKGAGYSISISPPGKSLATLLALTSGRIKSPSGLAASSGSNLRQELPGADLVIITRPDFFDSINPLVALRQSQGLSVAVFNVEDIYNSFSFGQKTPQAIKDFLAFAKTNYNKAPRYVLIVGDASLDAKNYLGFGENEIVPTKLIDTRLMETASDEWFVEATEMAIGRLPAGTIQDASGIVAKIVGYDQSNPSQEILLVADSNDEYNFEEASAQLSKLIPSSLRVEKIARGKDGDTIAKARLLDALVRGQKIVSYIGHGSVDQWKANLLTARDINEPREGSLPVFVMMTCLNGYFQDASLDSLAESLIKAPRGAVAVWTSSGMTAPNVQLPANQELFRGLFDNNNSSMRLGDAIRRAKAAAGSEDVRRTSVLFGDPTMRIR